MGWGCWLSGADEVARSCLPSLSAGGGVWKPHTGHLGRFFSHLDWTPGLGSSQQDNSVTGDLSNQPPRLKRLCLHLLACLGHSCANLIF